MTEEVPSVRSVALGLWVRTGSRNEVPAQFGLSHFLEHLLFKGTERYSAIEISERFDGLGASVNAATGKETTHLNARFLDEHTEEVFDLLAEMLLEPTYPDIDSERDVVLEEIAMYEDEPQDRVHDYLAEAVFGEHPLARRVLGDAEVIASIPVPEIDAYHGDRYTGANIVVAAAGHLEHERIVELAERLVEPEPGAPEVPCRAEISRPLAGSASSSKDTEQYHICFGAPGINRADERRFALAVLDSIFGGSTSSRLFRRSARSAGSPTRSAPTASSTPTRGWPPPTSARARRTSRRPARSSVPSWSVCAASRSPGRSWRGPRSTSRAASCSPRSPPRRGCRGSPGRRSSTCPSSLSTR